MSNEAGSSRSGVENGAAEHAPTDAQSASPSQPDDAPASRRGTAYEVAAALRAQASRAAQVTREAAQRMQSAVAAPRSDIEQMQEMPTSAVAEPHTGDMSRPVPSELTAVTQRQPVVSAGAARTRTGRVRKARLRLARVDPWSVLKISFMFSIAVGIMLVVAVFILWSVLDAAGVFTAVGDVVRDVTSTETGGGLQVESYLGLSRVLGFASLVAVFDVVLVTALSTLGAFLYNLAASLLGGLEVTLAEDE